MPGEGAFGVLSSRLIRAKVFATFVWVAGVYWKVFERHETCPFGKVFVICNFLLVHRWPIQL
jgi:hypothetical protein